MVTTFYIMFELLNAILKEFIDVFIQHAQSQIEIIQVLKSSSLGLNLLHHVQLFD